MVNKFKFPNEAQFKSFYNAWVALRKKTGNALMRQFWRKPDPNDNSPTASFRSRVPDRIQTRRKHKNDQNNYMKLKLLRKEIYSGRQLIQDVLKREKLKSAQIDLEYMEYKQYLREKIDPGYQCPEFKEFVKKEDEVMKVDLPEKLAEPYRPEDEDLYNREEEKDDSRKIPSQFDEESAKSSKIDKKMSKKESGMERNSIIGAESSGNSDQFSISENISRHQHPINSVSTPSFSHPINEKAVVDPTTVMQIAIMFKKLQYNGLQVDKDRIKINTHKPIKKEDYLNLSQMEVEMENYYRSGTKPKATKKEETLSGVKYTIFKARNGRIHILRKAKGGKYQVYDNRPSEFNRIKPELGSSVKRLKMTEDDEFEGIRNTYIPVLQNEVSGTFGEHCSFEDNDRDDDMSTDEGKDKEVEDDYTDGFIARYRKRKGKKRGANDLTISFKV
jgi:hypothetical protein